MYPSLALNSWYNQGSPWTSNPSASTFGVLGLLIVHPMPGVSRHYSSWHLLCSTACPGCLLSYADELRERERRREGGRERGLTNPTVALGHQVQGSGGTLCVKEGVSFPVCSLERMTTQQGDAQLPFIEDALPKWTSRGQPQIIQHVPCTQKRGPELCCVRHLYISYI